MKTFLIHQTCAGLKPIRIPDGVSSSRLPVIRSDSRPTAEECAAVWNPSLADSPPAPIIPQTLTAWQARAALKLTSVPTRGTLYDLVESAISDMPEGPEKVIVQTAWENNANFSRTSPTILSFAAQLGLTNEQIDQLFITGAKLVV